MNKYYFTFQEVLEKIFHSRVYPSGYPTFEIIPKLLQIGLYDPYFLDFFAERENTNPVVTGIGNLWTKHDDTDTVEFEDPHIINLFDMVYMKFKDSIICTSISENINYDKVLFDFFVKFYRIFITTYPTYFKTYDALQTYNINLNEVLKSRGKNINRFNDTPQNVDTEGVALKYTTNISINDNENEVPAGSTASLLLEGRRALYNVYEEWIDEFGSLFIEEGNLDI